MVVQWYYQNVEYAVIKNKDLLKIKKQKSYYAIQLGVQESDLADIQLISKCNKGWVVPLKNKKDVSIVDAFSKNIGRFKQKTKQNMG